MEGLSKAAKVMSLSDESFSLQRVYVDETNGSDETGSGTESSPYKTPLHTVLQLGGTDKGLILIKKEGTSEFTEIAKSALKKLQKTLDGIRRKEAKSTAAATSSSVVKEDKGEEQIVEDTSLPKAEKIKIRQATDKRGCRVVVRGWVANVRIQSRKLVFVDLRDGSTLELQCVLVGKLARSRAIQELAVESTIAISGEISPVMEGKTAPGGHELVADYFSIISPAPSGLESRDSLINDQALPQTLYDQRHLVIRATIPTYVLKIRSAVLAAFRQVYQEEHVTEITPPCMVQTQVEGGSTLFGFKYYGEDAYLTQSSQLYLETALPSLGDVYCIAPSFRAEKSHTRRHLSEYTHIEAELAFLSFDELLTHIEDVICRVVDIVLSDKEMQRMIDECWKDGAKAYIKQDPSVKDIPGFETRTFTPPKRPFRRMRYEEAIDWLASHDPPVLNKEGQPHVFGMDIEEAAERFMVDTIGEPIILTHFPRPIKAFYMQPDPDDPRVTESADILIPGVGEIVGGSMRIYDHDTLIKAFKDNGLHKDPYYWFTDQRKYGSCEHGGYGLGLERFLAWMTHRYTVRDCCLYPRFPGRCTP